MGIYNHGELGLIVMTSSKDFGRKVDDQIKEFREEEGHPQTYEIPVDEVRFSNGEGKVRIQNSVRGKDVYIISDVGNYGCTYPMYGFENRMSPDDHFQNIKRVLNAIGGKAHRVTLIMPLLYASRQHKRKGRESLDCAMGLRELEDFGVNTIITFDAHDSTIYNAIPNSSFENIYPTYSIIKKFVQVEGYEVIKDNMTVISPDSGAMDRAIYYADALKVGVGMYYKRRDHSKIVNGKNPIIQHQYIGDSLEGKNVLVIDDMLSSGESLVDIIEDASKSGAKRVYAATTFAFFTEGVKKFDDLYNSGKLTKFYSTNLSYVPDEIKKRPWFVEVDLSRFTARIINTLNHDNSISPLLDATSRIQNYLSEFKINITEK